MGHTIWESIYNPNFNYGEFDIIKSQAGLNSYRISIKEWVAQTNAIGIKATTGRYGGTYAHPDIAFEFGMWISAEFKIYLIKVGTKIKSLAGLLKNSGWLCFSSQPLVSTKISSRWEEFIKGQVNLHVLGDLSFRLNFGV